MLGCRRGQSEVIGMVLMTAIVVSAVTVAGVFIFDRQAADRESETDRALVDLQVEVNDTHIVVRHLGGDPIDASRATLVVNDTERQLDSTNDGQAYDSTFTAGEVRYFRYNGSGVVDVTVVSGARNEVLKSTTVRLPS
jgi:flagellin-like protein